MGCTVPSTGFNAVHLRQVLQLLRTYKLPHNGLCLRDSTHESHPNEAAELLAP